MFIIGTIFLILFIHKHVDVFADSNAENVKLQKKNATRLVDYLKIIHIPCLAISAYEGSVARLPCGQAKDGQKTTWMYAESIYNVTFNPMEEKETAVDNDNLTIYYVRQSDGGVYQCSIGSIANSLVVLQVLDDEDYYNVVKPVTSRGPYPSPPAHLNPLLMVYIQWFTWSGCSKCGQVGRQRRYGYCYVRYTKTSALNAINNSSKSNNSLLTDEDIKLFQAFPGGIPCKSKLLPATISKQPAVALRKNEIMIGLCKVPCKSVIFEVRGSKGEVLERANNSEGVFSLYQREPPQPPPVARDIIFATRGAAVLVKCPGTTLQDSPVTWRVGNKEVVPRELDILSGGRMHLNARDHIVITAAEDKDSNVYSCWQEQKLCGVIKLKLYCECVRHAALLALLVLLVLLQRAAHNLQRCVARATR